MNSIPRALILAPFLVLSCLFLASCGGSGGSGPPEIHIEGEWVRAMTLIVEEGQTGTNSAVYFTLRNDGGEPDRLTGGETMAAASVQIHESRMVDDVMTMRRVDGLDIRPGESVELKPGGVHIMLLGLTSSLVEGEEIDLTLHFLRSDDLVVSVPVRLLGGA